MEEGSAVGESVGFDVLDEHTGGEVPQDEDVGTVGRDAVFAQQDTWSCEGSEDKKACES